MLFSIGASKMLKKGVHFALSFNKGDRRELLLNPKMI